MLQCKRMMTDFAEHCRKLGECWAEEIYVWILLLGGCCMGAPPVLKSGAALPTAMLVMHHAASIWSSGHAGLITACAREGTWFTVG